MRKNWVNVLTDFPYSKRYYLTHPWKFFKDCYLNIKYAKQRICRGWCWVDMIDMNDYLMEIIPDMLRCMARDSWGYPGREPFETPEKWSAWLYYIAGELEECKEENYEKRNEYYEEYMKQFEDPNRNINSPQTELDKKYFAREKELYEEAVKRRTKALTEAIKFWDYLWD